MIGGGTERKKNQMAAQECRGECGWMVTVGGKNK